MLKCRIFEFWRWLLSLYSIKYYQFYIIVYGQTHVSALRDFAARFLWERFVNVEIIRVKVWFGAGHA